MQTEARSEAMERAGKLLAIRARTEKELTDRLGQAGFDEADVATTIERLKEIRLIDDAEFARSWVQERSARKGFGAERLRAELEEKGVSSEAIESALAQSSGDELARATAVAGIQAAKVATLPLPLQAARLMAFLARRGFDEDVVEEAVRAVLPPEGWD